MRVAAAALLAELDERERSAAALPFADDAARRWLEYRPRRRPGTCLATATPAARKAAHRLLATGLGEHGFAQAAVIMALEEVLDRRERGRMSRHSGDYWVCVFGDPAGDDPWSWRFEGHHLSVTMTVHGADVSPAPVFLGANPAAVYHGARPVSRPLGPEEDLGRALLRSLPPAQRAAATCADRAPRDIRSATSATADPMMTPLGVPAAGLAPGAADLLAEILGLYLDRLTPALARREQARIAGSDLYFAWAGPDEPGTRHYYRIQGDDLLIEYDNTTSDGNHAHTVLRRPRSDFGADILAAHRRQER
jgi:Protein of unknown function (DUF3500)